MRNMAKRVVSGVLFCTMLLNCFNLSAIEVEDDGKDNSNVLTVGQVVAENYEWLNEYEKAIMSSAALDGDRYTVNYPTESDGLIAVDADTKTVSAKNYVDDTNTWVPSSANVIYQNADGTDAEPISVTLDDSGNGSFSCPSDSYRVEVTYTLYADVAQDVQTALINAPAVLVEGVTNLESLCLNVKTNLMVVSNNIDALNAFTTGELRVGGQPISFRVDTNEYNAIKTMYDQCKGAGKNGYLTLYNMLDTFELLGADQKTQYLLDNAAAIKSELESLLWCTETLCDSEDFNLLVNIAKRQYPDLANKAEQGRNYLNRTRAALTTVNANPWRILSSNPVKEITADLGGAVADAYTNNGIAVTSKVNYYDAPELKTRLTVASTVLTQGVDQHKVNVVVRASVIDKNAVDSNDLVALDETATVSLVLDKGATRQQILSAIDGSGVSKTAENRWAEIYNNIYNINEDKYEIAISETPDSLTEDVDVTITYTPKKYSVSFSYADGLEVYYGYNLLLPKHEDAEKSYDYTVNGKLSRENTIVSITDNTEISRKEGKATSSYRIPAAITSGSVAGVNLTAEEKAVLNSFGLVSDSIWYRVPDASSSLVTVTSDEADVYKVEAAAYSSGLLSGAEWTAQRGVAVTSDGAVVAEFEFADGKATFNCGDFDHVEVAYAVSVSDITSAQINQWVNAPKTLADEAQAQKAAMSGLFGDIYTNLPQLTRQRLSMISAFDCTAESRAAIDKLIRDAFEADGSLKLYNYLTDYNRDGLAYYYKAGAYERINEQVTLLKDSLNILWADDALQTALAEDPDASKYKPRLDVVHDQLLAVELVGVNAVIDRFSPYIEDLVKAIENLSETHSYDAADAELVLTATVSGDAPDRASVSVTVQLANGRGDIVGAPVCKSISFAIGGAFTSADIESLEALISSMENELGIDKAHYAVSLEGTFPAEGESVTTLNLCYTWTPKMYTVTIDGTEQTFYADGNLSVTLPAWAGVNGYRYVYAVGDEKINVGSASVTYRFASLDLVDRLADENGNITITRQTVDVYREGILDLVDDLNAAIAKNNLLFGMNGQNCLIAAFIPLENTQTGELSVVLRVSPQNFPGSKKEVLTNTVFDAISSVVDSEFTYIGLNNQMLWNGKVYLQTLIDAALSSGLSFDSICDIISDDGDLKELTELDGATVLGADENGMIDVNGAKISHVELLGAKLLSASSQFGTSAQDARNVSFYITMEDYDLRADTLAKVERGIRKVQQYLDVKAADGKLSVSVKAPDSLYAYYLMAQTVAGNADISDLWSMDLGKTLEYDFNLIKDLFSNKDFTTATLERTLEKLGKTYDLSKYGSIFNTLRNAAAYIIENGNISGSSTGSVYSGEASFGIKDLLLNKLDLDQTKLGFIAEAADDTRLKANFDLKVKNMDTRYDAVIADLHAQGLDKLRCSTDLAAESVHDNTVIILLSDVTADLKFNSSVVIDLNGKTLTGSVEALGGKVRIVDSKLSTYACGGINGDVSGDVTIIGGKYTADVTAMLKDGYTQDANGYVMNKLYTVAETADGDVNIILSADFLNTANVPHIKTYLVDLAADLLVNMYPNAYFEVDGNVLYNGEIDNLVSLLDLSKTELVQNVIDLADLDGISNFANTLLAQFTDFGKLRQSLISGQALASYKAVSKAWDLAIRTEGGRDDNYLTADVLPGGNMTQRTINVFVSDSQSEDSALALLLDNLNDVVNVENLKVQLNSIQYNGSLSADAKGEAKVTLDFSKNPDYGFIIAAFLADTVTGELKAELIDAMNQYILAGTTAQLQAAVEKASVAQFVTAIRSISARPFADILASLNIEAPNAVYLEGVYHNLLNIVSVALAKTNIKGGSRTLSSFATGEYSTYNFSRANWHKCDIDLTVKIFGEDKAIVVKDSFGSVSFCTDDLAQAFADSKAGDTLYINKPVTLTGNVELDHSLEIVGAANIDMAGFTIALAAADVRLVTDAAIAVVCGVDGYKVIETEENGKYIYTLQQQEQPPVKYAITVTDASGAFKAGYTKDELAKALSEAADGDVLTISEPVSLSEDVTISAKIEIVGAVHVDMNGHTIALANAKATLTTDLKLQNATVVSGVDGYKVVETEENGKYIYSLEKGEVPPVKYAITVKDANGAVKAEYAASELASVLTNAVNGDVIVINETVTLTANAFVSADIRIENAGLISFGGQKIVLSVSAVVTADADIGGAMTSGADYYAVSASSEGGRYVYRLSALDPTISVPTVNVQPNGLIRGAKVDTEHNYIYLDVAPNGINVANFNSLVTFTTTNASNKYIYVGEGPDSDESRLVRTGDRVLVTANNSAKLTAVAYTVIILGDTNCNGRIEAGDAVRMGMHYVGQAELSGFALLAADMNQNGRVEAGDAVKNATKYTYMWDNNTYVSALGR